MDDPGNGASAPDHLSRATHRDLAGRRLEVWARRAGLTVLAALCALALAGAFGQRTTTVHARASEAELAVSAPTALRSGLITQVRAEVTAHRPIARPRLIVSEGWLDGVTVNTLDPEPDAEALTGEGLVLRYGALEAGGHLVVRLELQVNPTTAGRRTWRIALADGARELAVVTRDGRIYP